jgi:serine/threonine-protein kinase PRP4
VFTVSDLLFPTVSPKRTFLVSTLSCGKRPRAENCMQVKKQNAAKNFASMSKKQRRVWDDVAQSSVLTNDVDDDDLFGHAAASAEDRVIAERRARLRASAATPVKNLAPHPAPVKSPTPAATQSGAPCLSVKVETPPTVSASKNEARDLRAALLQLRDASSAAKTSDYGAAGTPAASGPLASAPVHVASRAAATTINSTGNSASKKIRLPVPVFDMFADTPVHKDGSYKKKRAVGQIHVAVDGVDDPVDEEGYARLRVDEALDNGRYLAGALLGQGVFASVYRATVAATGKVVAVKVLRNNDLMRRAGRREMETLQRIVDADPNDRRHCVRMLDNFEHRGHVVIVFEELAMNLRDVVKRFGGGGGIRLAAVRLYASQLLTSLHLLGQLGIVHADIKPDNALVSEDKGVLKLCDFGSAMDEVTGETDAMPYLVSRFYRAPEVVLGVLPYGRALDIWSVACVLYELYTGQILFPGNSNHDMLRLIQNSRGAVPGRMLRRATHRDKYYDSGGLFLDRHADAVSGAEVVRGVAVPERPRERDSVRTAMAVAARDEDSADVSAAPLLTDLLDCMLAVDPARRISAGDALKMPFFARTRR